MSKRSLDWIVLFLLMISPLPLLLTTVGQGTEVKAQGLAAGDDNHDSFTPKVMSSPVVYDSELKIQQVFHGISFATQMDFLGPDDIVVLQKNDGKVLRIKNCELLPEPILDLPVANLVERGLLGVALYNNTQDGKEYAFIYFTHAAKDEDGDDASKGYAPLGNRLYRFELVDGKLENAKPLFFASAQRGASHNSGVVLMGPDNNVYFAVGDIASHRTRAQNYENGSAADGTSAIIRINQNGESAGQILGREEPINKYYAYGIRNSYGLDFDPITGILWDTENGPDHSDEINLVEPGFNSGWRKIIGFPNSTTNFDQDQDLVTCLYCSKITGFFDRLINKYFYGVQDGKYSDPEFVSNIPIGITAIKFFNSDKLGPMYGNDVFVADYVLGNIMHFELNENRDAFILDGKLADKMANDWQELSSVTFAQGFRSITDLEVGPDGYLYVLGYGPDSSIYRIVPKGAPEPCTG
jgi:glucose/arabinose dehydrogenase